MAKSESDIFTPRTGQVKIIVMANQKGGVAKTSSTRNLAYSLAEMGQRVLAVDFDPQTNLTTVHISILSFRSNDLFMSGGGACPA